MPRLLRFSAVLFIVWLSATLAFMTLALAEDISTTVQETKSANKFQIFGAISGLSLVRTGVGIVGMEFGVGVAHIFHPKWSIGGGYNQGFSSVSLATVYSSFEFNATYALTGVLPQEGRTVSVGFDPVYVEKPHSRGGLRAMAAFSQYFFNGTASIYPYSGVGAAVFYEFSSSIGVGLRLGVRADTTANGASTLNVVKGMVQGLFWL